MFEDELMKISSRGPIKHKLSLELEDDELILLLSLLHLSSIRLTGKSPAVSAYTLIDKLSSISGITPRTAANQTRPKIVVHDDAGQFKDSFDFDSVTIVYR